MRLNLLDRKNKKQEAVNKPKPAKLFYDISLEKLKDYYIKKIKKCETISDQIDAVRDSYKLLPADIQEMLYQNLKGDRSLDKSLPPIRDMVIISLPIFVLIITVFVDVYNTFFGAALPDFMTFIKDNPELNDQMMSMMQGGVSFGGMMGELCFSLLVIVLVVYFADVVYVSIMNAKRKKHRILADIIVILHDTEEQ